MIYFLPLDDPSGQYVFEISQGSALFINVNLTNNFATSILINAFLNLKTELHGNEQPIAKVHSDPRYIRSKESTTVLFSFTIPVTINYFHTLTYIARFGDLPDCSILIIIQIKKDQYNYIPELNDKRIHLKLPVLENFTIYKNDLAIHTSYYTKLLHKILEGQMRLEQLRSSQLFSELMLTVCEIGLRASTKKKLSLRIHRIKRSTFFKNGVLVSAGTQILNWLKDQQTMLRQPILLNGSRQSMEIFNTWETWFKELFRNRFESEELTVFNDTAKGGLSFDALFQQIDQRPDQFFLFFTLGLMEISPQVKKMILHACSGIENPDLEEKHITQQMFAHVINENGSLLI